MKNLIFLYLIAFLMFSCSQNEKKESLNQKSLTKISSDKIQVLNFGTFHFGYTNDATTVEFDEHNEENKRQAHEIAKKLAEFKPTIILVEREPRHNEEIVNLYSKYLKNPETKFDNPTEIELLAFEIGRLSGTKKIYGIDHQMAYNFNIGDYIDNSVDKLWYDLYFQNPDKFYPEVNLNLEDLTLFEGLMIINNKIYLDWMIAENADMLSHAGTDRNFVGADEAAKYYQRKTAQRIFP